MPRTRAFAASVWKQNAGLMITEKINQGSRVDWPSSRLCLTVIVTRYLAKQVQLTRALYYLCLNGLLSEKGSFAFASDKN
jgi:hypothetical protein